MLGLSRPGFRKDYNKNQIQWISKIYEASNLFSRLYNATITENPDFKELYFITGRIRNTIAAELEQGNLDKYGQLRKRDKPAREFLLQDDATAIMSKERIMDIQARLSQDLKGKIYPFNNQAGESLYHVEKPKARGIDTVNCAKITEVEMLQEGMKFYRNRLPTAVQVQKAKTFQENISEDQPITLAQAIASCDEGGVIPVFLNPKDVSDLIGEGSISFFNDKIPLSHLFLYRNSTNGYQTSLLIYGSINTQDTEDHCSDIVLMKICEAYMAKIAKERDPEKAKTYIAKTLFMLAHVIPVKRGNATSVEIIMNALAEKAGMNFCLELKDDEYNWDIQALFLSHSMDEYVTWFKAHCKTLTPQSANLIRALKNHEAKLAQDITQASSSAKLLELSETQKIIAALIKNPTSAQDSIEAIQFVLREFLKNERLKTMQNCHIIKVLSNLLLSAGEIENGTAQTLLTKIDQETLHQPAAVTSAFNVYSQRMRMSKIEKNSSRKMTCAF